MPKFAPKTNQNLKPSPKRKFVPIEQDAVKKIPKFEQPELKSSSKPHFAFTNRTYYDDRPLNLEPHSLASAVQLKCQEIKTKNFNESKIQKMPNDVEVWNSSCLFTADKIILNPRRLDINRCRVAELKSGVFICVP